jgi:hypothetical protein
MSESSLSIEFEIGQAAADAPGVEVAVLATAGVELPGLSLAVDQLGASIAIVLKNDGSGLRPVFEPPAPRLLLPRGGLAELDLPGFGGGGYLEHLQTPDEWRGAITARIGPVSVDGFVLLITGPPGFSLLALLTAEFSPPIQLSFGFTLVGVGGMVGINRRPEVPALQAAASTGDLSKLLFPHDAAAEAPRLLPVLDRCFPASPGDFIVGPLFKLGWGTPTLVSATVGVLACSTGVVIVGRVAITLPFEQAALIRLEAVVLGVIDATGLSIAATLADSHIVGIPVRGDLRLRIRGGNDALFALSAGGFHPAFTPPDGMAGMNRISMEISPGPILRARLAAYLAVTSNSVQFGAAAELTAGIGGFGIHGHFAFDALIVFDPFAFRADLSAQVSIEAADFDIASIGLHGHFSGPAPYRISGHASISLLFFDVDVDIPEISWGPNASTALPPARDPLGVLAAEIGKPAGWTPSDQQPTLLARVHPRLGSHTVAVHPMAQLRFQQSAVPINMPLQRMDAVPLPAPVTLKVIAPVPTTLTARQQQFPPSQFFTQDDKAKLSSAGYATCDGGFDVNVQGAKSGQDVQTRDLSPETSVLGKSFYRFRIRTADLPRVGRYLQRADLGPPPVVPKVVLRDPGVAVIASTQDLTARTSTAAAAAGVATISDHVGVAMGLLDHIASIDPGAAVNLQAVSAWEVG